MLIEIVVFAAGIGLGAVPSVATYIAARRGLYADLVANHMKGDLQSSTAMVIEPPRGGSGVPLLPNFSLALPEILQQAKVIIKHAEQFPEKWKTYSGNNPRKNTTDSEKWIGVENTRDNIWCLKQLNKELYWLNETKITAEEYKIIHEGVTKALTKVKINKLASQLRRDESSANAVVYVDSKANKAYSTKELAERYVKEISTKEAVKSDIVDPFRKDVQRPYLYNREVGTLYGESVRLVELIEKDYSNPIYVFRGDKTGRVYRMQHDYDTGQLVPAQLTKPKTYNNYGEWVRGRKIYELLYHVDANIYYVRDMDCSNFAVTPEDLLDNYGLTLGALAPNYCGKMPSKKNLEKQSHVKTKYGINERRSNRLGNGYSWKI